MASAESSTPVSLARRAGSASPHLRGPAAQARTGNVVHEALACGTPVVATDVGAVPEMLGGGAYGIIVPVNDAVALQRGLVDALGKTWDRRAISAWGSARSWRDV